MFDEIPKRLAMRIPSPSPKTRNQKSTVSIKTHQPIRKRTATTAAKQQSPNNKHPMNKQETIFTVYLFHEPYITSNLRGKWCACWLTHNARHRKKLTLAHCRRHRRRLCPLMFAYIHIQVPAYRQYAACCSPRTRFRLFPIRSIRIY